MIALNMVLRTLPHYSETHPILNSKWGGNFPAENVVLNEHNESVHNKHNINSEIFHGARHLMKKKKKNTSYYKCTNDKSTGLPFEERKQNSVQSTVENLP